MYNRCCVHTDETYVCVSGDGQGFAAGPAFTIQPHNPALYEQRAEEPVCPTAAA